MVVALLDKHGELIGSNPGRPQVRVLSPKEIGTDDVKIGAGDTHTSPCNFFIIESFIQFGSGDQPLARVRQWRPSWCDRDGECGDGAAAPGARAQLS